MYCPSCGKTASVHQKFCRSCGFSLEKTAKSLIEELPDESFQRSVGKLEWLGRIGCFACIGGIALIALSIIFLLVTIFIPDAIDRGSAVGVMVSTAVLLLLMSVIFAAPYLYFKRFHRSSTDRQSREPTSLPQGDPATLRLSESSFQPIPSITERTTDLVAAEPKAKTDED